MVTDFRPIDERICVVIIKGKFYSLICAHAPTKERIEGEKDYMTTWKELTKAALLVMSNYSSETSMQG